MKKDKSIIFVITFPGSSIFSLKAIAKFFEMTIDELLSGDELLTIAEEDAKQKERTIRDLVFGLLDCGMALLLFLPFFGQKADGIIQEVSLLVLNSIQPYLKIAYIVFGDWIPGTSKRYCPPSLNILSD